MPITSSDSYGSLTRDPAVPSAPTRILERCQATMFNRAKRLANFEARLAEAVRTLDESETEIEELRAAAKVDKAREQLQLRVNELDFTLRRMNMALVDVEGRTLKNKSVRSREGNAGLARLQAVVDRTEDCLDLAFVQAGGSGSDAALARLIARNSRSVDAAFNLVAYGGKPVVTERTKDRVDAAWVQGGTPGHDAAMRRILDRVRPRTVRLLGKFGSRWDPDEILVARDEGIHWGTLKWSSEGGAALATHCYSWVYRHLEQRTAPEQRIEGRHIKKRINGECVGEVTHVSLDLVTRSDDGGTTLAQIATVAPVSTGRRPNALDQVRRHSQQQSLQIDVAQALADLDPTSRTIMERIGLRGEAQCDVAEDLSLPLTTLRTMLRRAKAALAEALSDYRR